MGGKLCWSLRCGSAKGSLNGGMKWNADGLLPPLFPLLQQKHEKHPIFSSRLSASLHDPYIPPRMHRSLLRSFLLWISGKSALISSWFSIYFSMNSVHQVSSGLPQLWWWVAAFSLPFSNAKSFTLSPISRSKYPQSSPPFFPKSFHMKIVAPRQKARDWKRFKESPVGSRNVK